jgi:hypothetical protein
MENACNVPIACKRLTQWLWITYSRTGALVLLNHANFADIPGHTALIAGRYTSAENPRQIQLALKILF